MYCFVFPAVLENVVEHAEHERNVGARANADELVGLGRRAREARVDHDHLAAGFLGVQHVQHRDRVRFGRIRADVQRALGVAHVVVRVGHRTVAPRVRHAGDGGGVADAGLVIGVVAAPEADPLAQQVGLLVVVLRRADHEHRIGPAFLLLQLEHLGADLVQRLVPRDAFVLAADELHRRLQSIFTATVLAERCTLGAVRAEVDGRIEHRFLAHPYAVLDHRVDGTADRAVRAHGALDDHRLRRCGGAIGGARLLHQRELRGGEADAHAEAGTAQERPPIHRGHRPASTARQAGDE